ncbi:MAG: hypothetical protein GQ544_10200 [Candidatus Aminicenantes bacterium]|nr:hypothetical protein [Candidatus Aminicenantes bacterium]
MKTNSGIWNYLYLLALALGLNFFRYLYVQTDSFTIQDFAFRPSLFEILICTAAFFLLLLVIWKGLSWIDQQLFKVDKATTEQQNLLCFLPLSFFLLSPLLLLHFVTASDLKLRLNLMLGGILAAVFLLKAITCSQQLQKQGAWDNLWGRFQGLSLKQKLCVLFFGAFFVYLLCTALIVSHGLAFSGDEPYYLLTSHSLYHDQDINVANNYDDRDFTHFYPEEYYPRIKLPAYARVGRKGAGYIYNVNQPGVSAIVLPQYALSHFFSGRVRIFVLKSCLAFWAALLGLQLFLLSREIWDREKLSLGLWALYAFTSPILFYAIHVYPEVPIALFSVFIFRKVRHAAPPSASACFLCGLLLASFPWFGLKYNMIFWPLLLVSLYYLVKEHKLRTKIFLFLVPPFLSMALFYVYVHALYGTFNPIAIYEGVLTPAALQNFRDVVWNTPVMLRFDSLLDYFLDQRDGLLRYSPIYFFSLLGAVEVFRRSKRDFLIFLFLVGPYLFNYAFFAHRQGSSPQGRVLTCISWILALLIGYFLVHNRKKLYGHLFAGAAGLSFVFVIVLLKNPRFLYQPTTHEFTFRGSELFIHLSNLHFYLPDFLPSFLKVNNLAYLPNYVWIALILLFLGGYLIKKDIRFPQNPASWAARVMTVLLIFLVWFSYHPRMVLLYPQKAAFSSGERVIFYSLGRNARMQEPGEFQLIEDDRVYTFNFTSWRAFQNIEFWFGSETADYSVELKLFDEILYTGQVEREIQSLVSPQPPSYLYRNVNFYQVKLRIKRLTPPSLAQDPFYFAIIPER